MCVPFPRTARPGCVVFSFGSNDQFEFEQAALDMTPVGVKGCEVAYAYVVVVVARAGSCRTGGGSPTGRSGPVPCW